MPNYKDYSAVKRLIEKYAFFRNTKEYDLLLKELSKIFEI